MNVHASRVTHTANALLWFINGIVWIGYAHVPMMGVASAAAMLLSIWLARME